MNASECMVTVVGTGSLAHVRERQFSLNADSSAEDFGSMVADELELGEAAAPTLRWYRQHSTQGGQQPGSEPLLLRCELPAALAQMKRILPSNGKLFVDRKKTQQSAPAPQQPGTAAASRSSAATTHLSPKAREIIAHMKDNGVRGRRHTLPWHHRVQELIHRWHPRCAQRVCLLAIVLVLATDHAFSGRDPSTGLFIVAKPPATGRQVQEAADPPSAALLQLKDTARQYITEETISKCPELLEVQEAKGWNARAAVKSYMRT